MRLTLRTLLAYLDNVLQPQDAAEIKTKVDSSKYAQRLLNRILQVISQPGIEAPRIQSKVPMGDANTMAEYLDGTMPPEKVSDVEMLCVESDSYLADAASAHQVLSLVLQQPAKVSRRLRQRLYDIPGQESDILQEIEARRLASPSDTRIDSAHQVHSHQANLNETAQAKAKLQQRHIDSDSSSDSNEDFVDIPAVKPVDKSQKSKVSNAKNLRSDSGEHERRDAPAKKINNDPPVLRPARTDPGDLPRLAPAPENEPKKEKIANALSRTSVNAGEKVERKQAPKVERRTTQRNPQIERISALLSIPAVLLLGFVGVWAFLFPDSFESVTGYRFVPTAEAEKSNTEIALQSVQQNTEGTSTQPPVSSSTDKSPERILPNEEKHTKEAANTPTLSTNLDFPAIEGVPTNPPSNGQQGKSQPASTPSQTTNSPQTLNASSSDSNVPAKLASNSEVENSQTSNGQGAMALLPKENSKTDRALNLIPSPFGKMSRPHQILMLSKGGTEQLSQAQLESEIQTESLLQTFPPFRPEIAVNEGWRLSFGERTQAIIHAREQNGVRLSQVELWRGRLVVSSDQLVNLQVEVSHPQLATIGIRLLETNSQIAIDRENQVSDPTQLTQASRVPFTRLVVLSGLVELEVGKDRIQLSAKQGAEIANSSIDSAGDLQDFPKWTKEFDEGLERDLATLLSARFTNEVDPPTTLRRLATDENWETKVLAAEALLVLGEPNSALDMIGNPDVNEKWQGRLYRSIRHEAIQSADVANAVKQALAASHSADADALLAAFGPLTDDQLAAGIDNQLAALLKSEDLKVRTVGFHALYYLTTMTKNYVPKAVKSRRDQLANQWQDLCNKKQIRNSPQNNPDRLVFVKSS